MRKRYTEAGIDCHRPQVFIYTDGLATDKNENYSEAKEFCKENVGSFDEIEIFVVLIPGSMSETEVNAVCADILYLSENITILRVDNCVNGLLATFNFLTSIIIADTCAYDGNTIWVKYDSKNIKVAANTPIQNGAIAIGIE